MSTTSAPFGVRPLFNEAGITRPKAYKNCIASGYATSIYQGEPVYMDTSVPQIQAVNANTSPTYANAACIGIFAGVEYVDASGKPCVSNFWLGGTTLLSGSELIVYVNDEQGGTQEFSVQADGTVAATGIGKLYNFNNITSGSAVTGLSAATLNHTALSAGQYGHFIVTGFGEYITNAVGDTYTIVRGRLAVPQMSAVLQGPTGPTGPTA
jgi:hypothetical protein